MRNIKWYVFLPAFFMASIFLLVTPPSKLNFEVNGGLAVIWLTFTIYLFRNRNKK